MYSDSFATPGFLFALLSVPVCIAFSLYGHWRRRRCVAKLAGGAGRGLMLRPRMRRWRALLLLIGLALLAIAAAGPQWGRDWRTPQRQGRDVIVVLDLSRSMNAEQPSRRTLATRALRDLADAFERHGGNRVALVGFAARARVFFPLTLDYDHLRHTLTQIDADDYAPLSADSPVSGTRIGAALKLAVQLADSERGNRPVIVLLSDGDDPADDDEWLQGVQEAKAKNLRVHAVGVGDPRNAETIPIGRGVLQFEGEPVWTRLDEERLKEIARRTDGTYLPAHRERIALGLFVQHLLDAEALRPESESDAALPLPQLRYAWFLLPAFGLLVTAMLLSDGPKSQTRGPVRSKAPVAMIALLAVLSISAADPPEIEALIRQGNEAFAQQQYEISLRWYEQAESLALDPGLVSFNKAAVYSRIGKHKEAIECYRRCLEDDAAPSSRRARANFDLGNALVREAGDHAPLLAQAVQAYRACLLEPDLPSDLRADARHNLELAQLLWLKARSDRKNPDEGDSQKSPPPNPPQAKNPLEQKDPGISDAVYQPVDSANGSKSKASADMQTGQASNKLHSGSIVVLPDEDAVVPMIADDALATLAQHAERIAEQRRRQRNSGGSNSPATKTGKPRMTRNQIGLLLLLAWPVPLLAQRGPIDPPVVGRPVDFSNVVGQYAIHATADPTEVHVEEPITLRMVITGEGPEEYQPRRAHLRLFPAWDDDFYVQEVPEEHQANPDKKRWLFVYRLRPKHTKIDVIDGIKLVFYNPDKPGKVKFETSRAEPIAIVVKSRPEWSPEVLPPSVPDSFYHWSDGVETYARPSFAPSGVQIASFLAVPPLVCLLGLWMRRRYFPDDVRRRQRHRSLAAQRALAHLQGGSEPAWTVLRRYLRERFDLAVDEPTPADVAAFLKRRGFAKDLCGQVQTFLHVCDAIIYASSPNPAQLSDDAVRLIRALEADPCARG